MRFQGTGGEILTIADSGSRYDAMVNGKSVGYLTYKEETEEGKRRMRFGYIHITNPAFKGKKLSALLVAVLALEALNRGILILCVGHPDPTLKAYWEAMGFDFRGEQQRQYRARQDLYRDQDIGSVDDVTVTEAEGPVTTALRWAQQSYRAYWQPL